MARNTEEKFFDIEKAIHRWGLLTIDNNSKNHTRKQKRLKKRQFVDGEVVMDIQIDWSHLSIDHQTNWSEIKDGDFKELERSSSSQPNGAGDAKTKRPRSPLHAADDLGTSTNILFQTDFKNDTEVTQNYTLKIEKTTRSSCTTEIENGVTNGIELCATLNIGDVLEVGTGFSREISLTKTQGETLENEVTWGAESTVTVPRNKKATAEMRVLEKKQSGDFTVVTNMTGYIIIKYISLKDGSLVFGHSGKIDTIVKDYVNEMKKEAKEFKPKVEYPGDSMVRFETRGKCSFRYGIKQVVTIQQEGALQNA